MEDGRPRSERGERLFQNMGKIKMACGEARDFRACRPPTGKRILISLQETPPGFQGSTPRKKTVDIPKQIPYLVTNIENSVISPLGRLSGEG